MESDVGSPEGGAETDSLVVKEKERRNEDDMGIERTSLLSETSSRHDGEPSRREDMPGTTDPRPSEQAGRPHPYHLKNKYTFRSDSVYSDVVPISAASSQPSTKQSEPREKSKSGSLSSLKAKESKWSTLKKKLGRLNSANASVSSKDQGSSDKTAAVDSDKEGTTTERHKPTVKPLHEKRSFLQRAKTLSIIPANRPPKEKEEPRKMIRPPELFNVGGEMNLIPLEMLIDVNSLNLGK